jgi:hypothetical protein
MLQAALLNSLNLVNFSYACECDNLAHFPRVACMQQLV